MSEPEFAFENPQLLLPKLARSKAVTVIGAGGPGRQLALQLVALGVSKLTVVDPSVVQQADVALAGFSAHEVGCLKVDVVGSHCHQAHSLLDYTGVPLDFQSSAILAENVFCCVEHMASRRKVWQSLADQVRFYADVRMCGDAVSLFTANEGAGRLRYATNLAALDDHGPPASTGLVCTAGIAASLAVYQFARHLRRLPVHQQISFDPANGLYKVLNDE